MFRLRAAMEAVKALNVCLLDSEIEITHKKWNEVPAGAPDSLFFARSRVIVF